MDRKLRRFQFDRLVTPRYFALVNQGKDQNRLRRFSKMTRLLGQFALVAALLFSRSLNAQDKAAEKDWKKNIEKGDNAWKKGQLNEASDGYAAAIADAEKFPAGDPRLAETLRKHGSVRFQLRELADAQDSFRRALAIDEQKWGTNDVRLAGNFLEIGQACMYSKRYDEADLYFARGQSLVEKKYGHFDRTVGLCLQDRGQAALMDKRLADAEKYLKDALELAESPRVKVNLQVNEFIERRVQEPSQGQIASVLNDFGMLYAKTQRYTEAEDTFKRCLKLEVAAHGMGSLSLCTPLYNYSDTLAAEHKYVEAKKQMERCYTLLKEAQSDHPMMAQVQRRLEQLKTLAHDQ